MEIEIFNLNLSSPINFSPAKNPNPFEQTVIKDTEVLFCFDLDSTQYLSFEPDREKLLKKIENSTELPMGNYIFTQKWDFLGRENIIELIIEMQKEALWQRYKPGQKLYLRYLYEDGKYVTQLFRQVMN